MSTSENCFGVYSRKFVATCDFPNWKTATERYQKNDKKTF